MNHTHEEYARAVTRVRGQTKLPDSRVREVLSTALAQVAAVPSTSGINDIERAVTLATERLWAEEKVRDEHR